MDITPQVINEVEFRQKVRGYDPDEVDDFLERMAVAVGQLQERLREAAERGGDGRTSASPRSAAATCRPKAARAECRPTNADTISRAILTAQRTADALVKRRAMPPSARSPSRRSRPRGCWPTPRRRRSVRSTGGEEAAKRAHNATSTRLLAEIEQFEATRNDLAERRRPARCPPRRAATPAANVDRRTAAPARQPRGAPRGAPAPVLSGRTAPAARRRRSRRGRHPVEAPALAEPSRADAARGARGSRRAADDRRRPRHAASRSVVSPATAGRRRPAAGTAASRHRRQRRCTREGISDGTERRCRRWRVDERGARRGPGVGPLHRRRRRAMGRPTAAAPDRLDAPDDDAYLAELRMAMAGEDDAGSCGDAVRPGRHAQALECRPPAPASVRPQAVAKDADGQHGAVVLGVVARVRRMTGRRIRAGQTGDSRPAANPG